MASAPTGNLANRVNAAKPVSLTFSTRTLFEITSLAAFWKFDNGNVFSEMFAAIASKAQTQHFIYAR